MKCTEHQHDSLYVMMVMTAMMAMMFIMLMIRW